MNPAQVNMINIFCITGLKIVDILFSLFIIGIKEYHCKQNLILQSVLTDVKFLFSKMTSNQREGLNAGRNYSRISLS